MRRLRPKSLYQPGDRAAATAGRWGPPMLTMEEEEAGATSPEILTLTEADELHLYARLQPIYSPPPSAQATVSVRRTTGQEELENRPLFEAPALLKHQVLWNGRGLKKRFGGQDLLPLSEADITALNLAPGVPLGESLFPCVDVGSPARFILHRPQKSAYYWEYGAEQYPKNTMLFLPGGGASGAGHPWQTEQLYLQVVEQKGKILINRFTTSQLKALGIEAPKEGQCAQGAYDFSCRQTGPCHWGLETWIKTGGLRIQPPQGACFESINLMVTAQDPGVAIIVYQKI